MNVRIVPHRVQMSSFGTWWKVQIRVTWLRIGRIRLWRWKTIGDYSMLEIAKGVAKAVLEEDMIKKDW